MGTVRLGKRTEARSPLIKDFVPLAELDDLVFGGWDIFEDDCYEAAKTAGVLERPLLDEIKDELSAIKPMSAVFDRHYVKRLDGPNVKKGRNKRDLAEQLIQDIRDFKAGNGLDRLGPCLVREHRNFSRGSGRASVAGGLRKGAGKLGSGDSVEHDLRVRGDQGRFAVRQRRAEPERRRPRAGRARPADRVRLSRARI